MRWVRSKLQFQKSIDRIIRTFQISVGTVTRQHKQQKVDTKEAQEVKQAHIVLNLQEGRRCEKSSRLTVVNRFTATRFIQ